MSGADRQRRVDYEISCGVIPFRRIPDRPMEFLLLHSVLVRNPDAAWEFPKGSMDEGETETETALRELQEETGIVRVELLPNFRDHVHYKYRREGREIEKTVTFFTGEVKDWSVIPDKAPTREHGFHPRKGIWHVWATEEEAHRYLFHPGMRSLLERTSLFIYEHDRIARAQADDAQIIGEAPHLREDPQG